MPDYSQGKIYTIRSKTDDTLIYVGSTCQSLAMRMSGHRTNSKREKFKNRLFYKTVAGDWSSWFIELHQDFPCERKEQLNKREGEVQREIGTLNARVAGRTLREYQEDNAEALVEKQKKYRQDNADAIAEYFKKYTKDNAEAIAERMKKYYKDNAEAIIDKCKKYRQDNAEAVAEYQKKYNKDNAEALAEKKRLYYQKKKAEKNAIKFT